MASPTEWNRLPQSVRSQQTITGFRTLLKTFLFRLAYPPPWSISLAGANFGSRPDTSLDFPFLSLSTLEDVTSFCAI